MKLLINTTDRQKLILQIDGNHVKKELRLDNSTGHDQILLASIADFLNSNSLEVEDLTSIVVDPGPGSFTGTRVGVAVANSLALALNIPVNGHPVGCWAEPKYAAPAHISQPQSRRKPLIIE